MKRGNVGRGYIDGRLEETRNYMEVYDLIQIGEEKEENGNLEGALESYKQARKLASSLYFTSGKDEAMSRQAQAEEQLDQQAAEKQQEEEKVQAAAREEAAKELESQAAQQELGKPAKANDQKNAIELENQGNQLLAQGQFESAITYYPDCSGHLHPPGAAGAGGRLKRQDWGRPGGSGGKGESGCPGSRREPGRPGSRRKARLGPMAEGSNHHKERTDHMPDIPTP